MLLPLTTPLPGAARSECGCLRAILIFRSGLNRHLHMQQLNKGSRQGAAAASGRWVRVSKYSSGNLNIFGGENAACGAGATTLKYHLLESNWRGRSHCA